MDGIAGIFLGLTVAFIPIVVAILVKGNAKLARILVCFFITGMATAGALISKQYFILIFAGMALIMGFIFIFVDDETDIWKK